MKKIVVPEIPAASSNNNWSEREIKVLKLIRSALSASLLARYWEGLFGVERTTAAIEHAVIRYCGEETHR